MIANPVDPITYDIAKHRRLALIHEFIFGPFPEIALKALEADEAKQRLAEQESCAD